VILPDDCSPAAYAAQFDAKRATLEALLAPFAAPALELHASPPVHYRQRAEFRVWHEGDALHFLMFDGREPVRVERFLPGAASIDALMPRLRAELAAEPLLRRKLYQLEFLSTLSGEMLVTLVYHRPLDDAWEGAARALQARLGIHLIGRARRQRRVLTQDFVTERLTVGNRVLEYRQPEGCFTQPNASVNRAMLAWAEGCCADAAERDLVELYCGIGNFTAVLAPLHRRVLATEIDATATAAAHHNLAANGVSNTFLARLSSAEASAALARERPFRRLAGFALEDFAPCTLMVDPPRAGLDARTLAFAAGFERIVYVSCNPHTLCANLRELGPGWRIERAALFDQFPYTPHMECCVLLHRAPA
jgi:tRNA (uracil-5-)-methyltransferase